MKRPMKQEDGNYHIKGQKYPVLIGSRRQVYNETAYKTPGGLVKSELLLNKNDRIVSRKKHFTAKKEKRLEKAGYFTKKGTFGYFNKSKRVRYLTQKKTIKSKA
jgi:hypothetical protein